MWKIFVQYQHRNCKKNILKIYKKFWFQNKYWGVLMALVEDHRPTNEDKWSNYLKFWSLGEIKVENNQTDSTFAWTILDN